MYCGLQFYKMLRCNNNLNSKIISVFIRRRGTVPDYPIWHDPVDRKKKTVKQPTFQFFGWKNRKIGVADSGDSHTMICG